MSASSSASSSSLSDDPSVQSVAKVYAVSLLNAAGESGQAEAVLEEYASLIQDVLQAHPEFERLLTTDVTSQEEKLRLLETVLGTRGSPLLVNTLKVLAHHDRLNLIRAVYTSAVREHERRSGRVRVQVTTAVPLSSESLSGVTQRLSQALSAEPIIESVIDPEVLGGLVIRIGDTVYDGSVRNRLRQLRGKLRERCLNEVQRGRDRFSHPEGN